MPGVTIVPRNQKVPAHYLNRSFAIDFNLPKLGKLVDPSKSFPTLPRETALALATLSLTRLLAAIQGRAQSAAQHTANWDVEIADAKRDALLAEAAVHAAFPAFATSTDILTKLRTYASPAPAPAALPVNWSLD